nr:MAG TPA: large terminase [Caudoviricetes sp.]
MVDWKPFSPKALDFIRNSTARLNIAHGAVRSSKTISCTVRWLSYLLYGPPGDVAMLGRTTATLQRNVLNDLFDTVGPQNYKWVNRQQGELRIFNRRVYCFGANNEDAESKIRGATFAGALCDEVNLYPQSVFNQLMARLSVEGAKCFCNCNPDSPYHWFYTDYIMNDEITDKKVWKFLMEDNLSLSQSYIESLKQMYRGVWYERMILGNWVAAEGRIYDMFEPSKHMLNAEKFIADSKVHLNAIRWLVGCDYGTSTVMSWGLYAKLPDFRRTGTPVLVKVREFYYDAAKRKVQKTDAEFIEDFKKWLNGLTPWAVYCDPSAASWKVALMRAGYRVLNANNDVINGIRYVATCISTGSFVMDKSCVNTEKEYASYVWDSNAQRLGVDKPLKEHDHTCDTDRYVLYTDSLGGMSGVYTVT